MGEAHTRRGPIPFLVHCLRPCNRGPQLWFTISHLIGKLRSIIDGYIYSNHRSYTSWRLPQSTELKWQIKEMFPHFDTCSASGFAGKVDIHNDIFLKRVLKGDNRWWTAGDRWPNHVIIGKRRCLSIAFNVEDEIPELEVKNQQDQSHAKSYTVWISYVNGAPNLSVPTASVIEWDEVMNVSITSLLANVICAWCDPKPRADGENVNGTSAPECGSTSICQKQR